jgi:hypothetical protein
VQSLKDVCADRTTVVATHRPAPASVADHVYPMGAAPRRPHATAAVAS